MASGSRSPHNARIAFDCKDTWQSCCSALAPGVALNGPSMRSMRRWATSPLPPSVRLLPPSGRSPRSSAARRHRARHRGWRLHPHPEGPSHRAGAGERANGTALRAAKHAPVLRLHTNLPELYRSKIGCLAEALNALGPSQQSATKAPEHRIHRHHRQ